MKTSIIPKLKEKEEIVKGNLIITYKNDVKTFVAIYGGLFNHNESQYHTYFPLYSFIPQMSNYKGIKKKELINNSRFKIEIFTEILRIEQGDTEEWENSLLLVTDIDERPLYYAICQRVGIILGQKIFVTPLKIINPHSNFCLGNDVWVSRNNCFLHIGKFDLIN